MTERRVPNPPSIYRCLWEDEPRRAIVDILATQNLNVTRDERDRFSRLLNGKAGLPADSIISYPGGVWVGHVTGDVYWSDDGRPGRTIGARVICFAVDRNTVVIVGAFFQHCYNEYLAQLRMFRDG
jgi:hypothetical protein